jgi:uncharacterized membrane protein
MSHHLPSITARTRLIISIVVGIITGILIGLVGHPFLAPLIGWDLAAVVYLLLVWPSLWPMDGRATKEHAAIEDPTRKTSHTILTLAAVASLGAAASVLARDVNGSNTQEALLALLTIFSVVLSWLVIHTLYALRYAVIYYKQPEGGVDFNQAGSPAYSDFAYLAFTIGMTFQVSDTAFNTRKYRKVALSHALFSYLFGTVIVAATINLIAGLGK